MVDDRGRKLVDPDRSARLRADLLSALEAVEAQPAGRSRAHLQKARASVAR